MSKEDRPILAPDLAVAVAEDGGDRTLEGRELHVQNTLCRAIATRRGYCFRDVHHAGCKWVVALHARQEQGSSKKTLKGGLAWWLMATVFGIVDPVLPTNDLPRDG